MRCCRAHGSIRKEELGIFPSVEEGDGREGQNSREH